VTRQDGFRDGSRRQASLQELAQQGAQLRTSKSTTLRESRTGSWYSQSFPRCMLSTWARSLLLGPPKTVARTMPSSAVEKSPRGWIRRRRGRRGRGLRVLWSSPCLFGAGGSRVRTPAAAASPPASPAA
jgi:hypothetical protein